MFLFVSVLFMFRIFIIMLDLQHCRLCFAMVAFSAISEYAEPLFLHQLHRRLNLRSIWSSVVCGGVARLWCKGHKTTGK